VIKVTSMIHERAQPVVHNYDDECGFHVSDRTGVLTIARGKEIVTAYPPGVWKQVTDVGAFIAAQPHQEQQREDPQRRQEIRAVRKA
jgi:hypothetical protein